MWSQKTKKLQKYILGPGGQQVVVVTSGSALKQFGGASTAVAGSSAVGAGGELTGHVVSLKTRGQIMDHVVSFIKMRI